MKRRGVSKKMMGNIIKRERVRRKRGIKGIEWRKIQEKVMTERQKG